MSARSWLIVTALAVAALWWWLRRGTAGAVTDGVIAPPPNGDPLPVYTVRGAPPVISTGPPPTFTATHTSMGNAGLGLSNVAPTVRGTPAPSPLIKFSAFNTTSGVRPLGFA